MNKWVLEDARMLGEGALYKDATTGVLTCRGCKRPFKRKHARTSPCCPDCTLSKAGHLAKAILEDEAIDAIARSDAERPVIDTHAVSPTPLTAGLRWIALMPIVNSEGWQVARGRGHNGAVIELLFEDPISAQEYADRYTRGKGPGRVLEIELLDAAERSYTREERHQRAERLSLKYFEQERELRPVPAQDPAGEEAAAEERRAVRNSADSFARMVLAGPTKVMPGEASHPCRRCNASLTVEQVFCMTCTLTALRTMVAFIAEMPKQSETERIAE